VHYRDFWFSGSGTTVSYSGNGSIAEIATYLKNNPTLAVGLDGANNNHVQSIRTALIDAGVSADRIKTGAFGDEKLRRDNHVEVLLMTGS